MIHINNLEKSFSSGFNLNIDELNIQPGERVALIGPNGSGKSTLLRLLSGNMKPDRGEIKFSPDKVSLGYQPQEPYCFSGTVEYNVKLGAKNASDIDSILEECDLIKLKNQKVKKLSGGEKQRMCLARMIAGKYDLLLLDEPLSAVDVEISEKLEKSLIRRCEENGTTLLISTHLPSQAMRVSTKILLLRSGSAVEYTNTELFSDSKTEFGRKFINQWRL